MMNLANEIKIAFYMYDVNYHILISEYDGIDAHGSEMVSPEHSSAVIQSLSRPSRSITSRSVQFDAQQQRRSSSRSIKRKKFDDELVESSLIKTERSGSVGSHASAGRPAKCPVVPNMVMPPIEVPKEPKVEPVVEEVMKEKKPPPPPPAPIADKKRLKPSKPITAPHLPAPEKKWVLKYRYLIIL